ncbi:MAG: 50S ribosomal protein L13 [Chloroflexi bacterium]|nr:50S ribosomal protein L13 [Chloroflexota bacterium]
MKRTYSVRPQDIKRGWHLYDASQAPLGRLATAVAQRLMGKDKAIYSRHMDVGDFVVVVNAEKLQVTGNKEAQKLYRHHTQYPGGLRETSLEHLKKSRPERVIERAVWGMLPKNKLASHRIKRLKVFRGSSHPYEAQVRASIGEGQKEGKGEV